MSASLQIAHNYEKVLEALEKACQHAGRKRAELTLVAVSKFHSPEDIKVVAEAGQADFGENYLQEAEEKKVILANCPDIRWHMIGHVQSRKAAAVAGKFSLIHSLDSIKLARAMEKALVSGDAKQDVLIEVNIADEPQKGGIAIGQLQTLAEFLDSSCPHLNLRGLMCMPPAYDSGEAARPYFSKLFKLREALSQSLNRPLPDLSMGMSGDFRAAIDEGASIVRIGTDIFGPRPSKTGNGGKG